jgi:hypothetical protein
MDEKSVIAPEQAPTARVKPKGRRRADLPFPEFIKGMLDKIDGLGELQERRRLQTYSTITRRYRGDLMGFYASDNSGTWIECKTVGLKRVNIIAPVVRANNKNWLEAQVRLEVTPSNSDPEVAGGADLAQSILDQLCARDWNEHLEEMISELAQFHSCYFLYSRFNKELGPKIKVPRMARRDLSVPSQYSCATCGATGPAEQATTGSCPTPGCGAPVRVSGAVGMQDMDVPDGADEQPGGDNETVIFTAYEIKVDERNAKGGELKDCRFLRNNFLVFRNELETMRPWAKLDGNAEWSPGLKQQRALETSAGSDGLNDGSTENDEDLLDYRRYWLSRKRLMGYVSPSDYQHGDAEMGYSFEIKAGQTMEDVFLDDDGNALPFEGLYVERHGSEILMYANEDLNDRWTAGHWQMDATAFYGKAQEDLLDLQEMRIEMVNIFFQAGMSMSLPPLIIDGRMFDGEDFVNDPGAIVYTRKGFNTENRAISDYIHQMFPQGPGSEMFSFYELLVASTDESSGISPVSVGQGDAHNQTLGGQQLLTQRAVGLILPSQKSKAKAKREWAYQQLILWQKYCTASRYVPIKTKYGEEWKEADVEAFQKANIRQDFIIRHVEGSENPQSQDERAQKIGTVLASGILSEPSIPIQLKQMVFRMAGIDYDIEDFEAEIRGCNARKRRVDQIIQMFEGQGQAWAVDEQGLPAQDPFGQPVVNQQTVMLVLNAPGCQIIPESDNHAVHREFWADQIRAEAAKDDADPFKIAVYRARVQEQQEATPPTPNVKMMETMTYKDAVPFIKRQMEAAYGYKPAPDAAPAADPNKTAEHNAKAVEGDKKRAADLAKQREAHTHEVLKEAVLNPPPAPGSQSVSAPRINA